jgi:MFS family permease
VPSQKKPSPAQTLEQAAAEQTIGPAPGTPVPAPVAAARRGPAPEPGSRLGVLRHAHFRNVWLGAFASSIGGWMESTGIRWIIEDATKSALMLGWLSAAQTMPVFFLSTVGGLVADRVNRKKLLIWTQVAMMAIAGTLMGLSWAGLLTPRALLILSVAQGVALAFNMPAWQVLTPRLVPRDELTRAIMLNGLQFNVARVVGPALAGPILVWSALRGPTYLFAVNTLSFLAVIGAVWTTPDAPAPKSHPSEKDGEGFWAGQRHAFAYVFRNPGPKALFWAVVVFSMLGAPLLTMLPEFIAKVYERGASSFSTMLAVMGLGAVTGVFAIRAIPHWYPKHHFIPISITAAGVTIVAFAACSSYALGLVAMYFAGIFWLWIFNSCFAAMQLLVSDRMRGRVMGVLNTAAFGATPIGSVVAGVVGEFATGQHESGRGVQIGVGVMGAVLFCAGIVMLIWRTPEIDALPRVKGASLRSRSIREAFTASEHRPRPGERVEDKPVAPIQEPETM